MKREYIYKAQGVGDQKVTSVMIVIDAEMPQFDHASVAERSFNVQADRLADALCSALPGGTLDRLISKLLIRKATSLVVPLI